MSNSIQLNKEETWRNITKTQWMVLLTTFLA